MRPFPRTKKSDPRKRDRERGKGGWGVVLGMGDGSSTRDPLSHLRTPPLSWALRCSGARAPLCLPGGLRSRPQRIELLGEFPGRAEKLGNPAGGGGRGAVQTSPSQGAAEPA